MKGVKISSERHRKHGDRLLSVPPIYHINAAVVLERLAKPGN